MFSFFNLSTSSRALDPEFPWDVVGGEELEEMVCSSTELAGEA
jgi:hypothetical protein